MQLIWGIKRLFFSFSYFFNILKFDWPSFEITVSIYIPEVSLDTSNVVLPYFKVTLLDVNTLPRVEVNKSSTFFIDISPVIISILFSWFTGFG